jgi:hypothetical protein
MLELMLEADGFGPDGLSRVRIVQFVAIGASATSSREYFLHEAIRHELVTALRCVLFARIALGDAPFQRSQSRSVVHEENEVSGSAREWARSNARRANRQTFSSTMAARIKSPRKLPDGREREDESTDRPGAALWSSVFAFLMEGFAAYGAAVHGVSNEAVLNAARRPHPWSARRAPISAEHEHGPHLISENGHVDGNWLSS